MEVTRETILAEAKKLGLTLTEEQIAKLLADGKNPDEDYRAEIKKQEILDKVKDPEKALEMINDLYAETKKRKDKIKELQEKLDKIEKEKKEQEEAKLKEEGKFKELLEAKEKELKELGDYKNKYEGLSTKVRENTLAKIKPEYMEFAKSLSDEQLAILPSSHFLDAPNNPHGGTPAGNGEVKLSDTQKTEAERMNLDDKDYAEVMAKRKQNLEKQKTT